MTKIQQINLEYPMNPQPRYGYGKPAHQILFNIINNNREVYRQSLTSLLDLSEYFLKIPVQGEGLDFAQPYWVNGAVAGLDAMAIYAFLVQRNPHRYFEIGSGNSTKFARQAIKDHGLKTAITSFDPHPHFSIDSLCDHVVRKPLEDVDPSVFEQLEAGDILFIDHSHYAFMNSDSTVVFLDILPRLQPGVLVEFHDIFLPLDYPPEWREKFYGEQYLLAAYLLGGSHKVHILLPNAFISVEPELKGILNPLWNHPSLAGIQPYGGSFWMEIAL